MGDVCDGWWTRSELRWILTWSLPLGYLAMHQLPAIVTRITYRDGTGAIQHRCRLARVMPERYVTLVQSSSRGCDPMYSSGLRVDRYEADASRSRSPRAQTLRGLTCQWTLSRLRQRRRSAVPQRLRAR